jgi:predicted ATPase/DNA-binding CsgD family transcriptional regulator
MEAMEMPSWLPVGVAAFIGREHEVANAVDLVAGARVVTFTGGGGCGKTRLALEVAGAVASRFRDGACWVDLQGLSDPALVAPAVGEAVGVHERPDEALVDSLVDEVRPRHLLVVLDSCEHLVDACAELVGRLSTGCPHLHVLATSRLPLVVAGEATFYVGPLPVPDLEADSARTVAEVDSARLFEVRARQVDAGFRIRDDNASAVAAICRHLDGIPLAIELAAARVRALPPHQIAAGLSDRFGLLTGGPRGAPARQRTLEASIDWSYSLLDDVQRLALARSSVFAGSFELDAAAAVLHGDGIGRDDVLDLIAGLVERSLLQVGELDGRARYRLLETIRVYAGQRLSELDDPDRVRGRHLEFHVALAERAREGLHGGQPQPWVTRLAADLDDLRVAMDWAAQTEDLRALVSITEPIVRFWFERGLSREVHRRLHHAAEPPGPADDERARGLNAAAGLALASCDAASFHRSAHQAVAAARAGDAPGALAVALGQRALSGVLSGASTGEEVAVDVEQSLELAALGEDPATHAHVLQFAGAALLHSRSIDAGYQLFQQGVQVCEANELSFHLPAAHGGAAAWLAWSGRLDRTHEQSRRTVELSRQLGRPGWEAAGLTGLAAAAVLEGDHAQAQRWLSEAQAALRPRALDGTHYAMWSRHWRGLSAYASGDLDAATDAAEEIVQIGRGGGSRLDEAIGHWLLGTVGQGQGRLDQARAHLEASHALSTDAPLPHTLGRSLLGLAEIAHDQEDLDESLELAHRSLEVLDDYGDRVGGAAALELVARLSLALDDPERSLRLLAASQRFHHDTGIVRDPVHAERFDRAVGAARASVEPYGAAACWDEGGGLSLADAIAYARRGRGERQRPRIGWASLTPVELDVVRLVAEGHTNAAIGRQLFISANTVKKHLSSVYAKVDVDGRAELAAHVARRQL